MKREEAVTRLKERQGELKAPGVRHLYLFGSTARNDSREDSDVDLFFDYDKGRLGLYGLIDVKERAALILGRPTDIMARSSLHPHLKKRIEDSAILVF